MYRSILINITLILILYPTFSLAEYPTVEEVMELCECVANEGWEEKHFSIKESKIDINNDGIKEITHSSRGGTAYVPEIGFKDENGNTINIRRKGYEWKTYWTFGYKYLVHSGKIYILHCEDDSCQFPRYIEFVARDNNAYVACEFEQITLEESLTDTNMCNCLKGNNSNKYIKLDILPELNSEKWDRWSSSFQKSGFVDIDNDGVEENIVLVGYYSGAGRGCDYHYFDMLSKDGLSIADNQKRNKLLELQEVEPGADRYTRSRVPHCTINDTGWLVFNGQVYYETKYMGDTPSKDSSFHKVLMLNKEGVIRDICEYNFSTKSKVSKTNIIPY